MNDYMLRLENRYGVPVRILANEQIKIERSALEELEQLLELQQTVASLRSGVPGFFEDTAGADGRNGIWIFRRARHYSRFNGIFKFSACRPRLSGKHGQREPWSGTQPLSW